MTLDLRQNRISSAVREQIANAWKPRKADNLLLGALPTSTTKIYVQNLLKKDLSNCTECMLRLRQYFMMRCRQQLPQICRNMGKQRLNLQVK
jgi:hypothetical protein